MRTIHQPSFEYADRILTGLDGRRGSAEKEDISAAGPETGGGEGSERAAPDSGARDGEAAKAHPASTILRSGITTATSWSSRSTGSETAALTAAGRTASGTE